MAFRIVPMEEPAPFKSPRIKNEAYLKIIRELPCVTCGAENQTEAAHLRHGSVKHNKPLTGGGRKPSDRWVTPLCNSCHRSQHSMNEMVFWKTYGVEPFGLCNALYATFNERKGEGEYALINAMTDCIASYKIREI